LLCQKFIAKYTGELNFENCLAFAKVGGKNRVHLFPDVVYIRWYIHTTVF